MDKVVDVFVVLVVQASPGRSHARCVQRQVLWLRIAKNADFPQLQHINQVVYIPVEVQRSFPMVQTVWLAIESHKHPCRAVVTQMLIPMVRAVQQTVEISQLQFAARWSMSRLSGSCSFSGAGCDETARSHSSLRKSVCAQLLLTRWSMSLECRSCEFNRCRGCG